MTKLNLDRLEADRKKWADRLLGSYDKFMASEPMSKADKEAFKAVCCASIFAAAAYEQTPGDEAAHAIARSFLLALADPMHPDLDYLRADPNAAVESRAMLAKHVGEA